MTVRTVWAKILDLLGVIPILAILLYILWAIGQVGPPPPLSHDDQDWRVEYPWAILRSAEPAVAQ